MEKEEQEGMKQRGEVLRKSLRGDTKLKDSGSKKNMIALQRSVPTRPSQKGRWILSGRHAPKIR